MRKRSHVARALHVVLSAQRVDTDALASEIPGGHRQVRDAHHHRRALAVFGDAKAVVDGAVRRRCIETRGAANERGRHAGDGLAGFRRIARLGDERLPFLRTTSGSQRSAT